MQSRSKFYLINRFVKIHENFGGFSQFNVNASTNTWVQSNNFRDNALVATGNLLTNLIPSTKFNSLLHDLVLSKIISKSFRIWHHTRLMSVSFTAFVTACIMHLNFSIKPNLSLGSSDNPNNMLLVTHWSLIRLIISTANPWFS